MASVVSKANLPVLEGPYLLEDTEPATDVFRAESGWYWNFHGETGCFGPFRAREAAEADAREP